MPWQAGGVAGADQAAWTLVGLLRAREREGKGRTWVAFLDGESAYCRVPEPAVTTGLWRAGISEDDWLAIRMIQKELKGTAKIGKDLVEASTMSGATLKVGRAPASYMERELQEFLEAMEL